MLDLKVDHRIPTLKPPERRIKELACEARASDSRLFSELICLNLLM